MVYYNADGNESSMCGNGGRCIVAFAEMLGVISHKTTFNAIDGLHHAFIDNGYVKLQMQDVEHLTKAEDYVFLDTGDNKSFRVRTYERGVEDETLSCGTGVTAVALAMHYIGETEKNSIALNTQGGTLTVSFEKVKNGYKDIWLQGPATQVFKGEVKC